MPTFLLKQKFEVVSPKVELVDLGTEFGMDVADDGSASVHVFDGKVELYESCMERSAETRREFTESESASDSADGEIVQSNRNTIDFVSSTELHQLSSKRNSERLQQWKADRQSLISDPQVVLHCSFEKEPTSGRLLRNHSSKSERLDGAIIGCRWTDGRWLRKDALGFKHPGDRVRLQIPGDFDSLTYSAWVRIDGLDRPFIALMLTNGYDVGEPHWQLRDDGRLLLGIQTPGGACRLRLQTSIKHQASRSLDTFGHGLRQRVRASLSLHQWQKRRRVVHHH